MSEIKNVLKNGWHPKGKDGGKESWRGDYKGINQVAGWVGHGKQPGSGTQGSSHVSRPLATLKDPAAFGPPPKNVNYHGGAALPNEITPHVGGIGAPLMPTQLESARNVRDQTHTQQLQDQNKPAPPALPFRADRTGLQTNNLPPPPVRRDGSAISAAPGLPPRLPSRQNTATSPTNTMSPPPYEPPATSIPTSAAGSNMNQSAINRLGSAGISVPVFGIGKSDGIDSNPWKSQQSKSNESNSVSELQSRFKRFNTGTASSAPTPSTDQAPSAQPPPPAMPSWQQTQSSLRTAQNFQKDPASITLADAQNAAVTAQSAHANAQAFQARHADQIDAAGKRATTLNKKYNMTGRFNKFLEDANSEQNTTQQQPQTKNTISPTPTTITPTPTTQTSFYQRTSPPPPTPSHLPIPPIAHSIADTTPAQPQPSSIGRKPPPPPTPRKPGNLQAPPPPVPLGTKPR